MKFDMTINKNSLEKHFTASALIIDKNKVLLVNHKKLGVWLYPGGHIEANETPEQAVIREVKEETGLNVEIIGKKDEKLADQKNGISVLYNPYVMLCELVGNHYHNDIIFCCRIIGGKNKYIHNPSEADGIGFFGKKDLKNIKLFPNFRKLLEKVLS